jgi:hypothetical protein
VACVLGIATLVALCARQGPVGINKNGFAAIREGMTLEEVEAIFGRAPGDYTVKKNAGLGFRFGIGMGPFRDEEWISDHGWITLTFDREGKVIRKEFREVDDLPDRSFFEAADCFYRQAFGRE